MNNWLCNEGTPTLLNIVGAIYLYHIPYGLFYLKLNAFILSNDFYIHIMIFKITQYLSPCSVLSLVECLSSKRLCIEHFHKILVVL